MTARKTPAKPVKRTPTPRPIIPRNVQIPDREKPSGLQEPVVLVAESFPATRTYPGVEDPSVRAPRVVAPARSLWTRIGEFLFGKS